MPSFAVPATPTSPVRRPTVRRPTARRIPPNRPDAPAAGDLVVTLAAVPNADFPPGSHERTIQVDAHEVPVADLAEARQVVADFVAEHDLGGGNIPILSGVVRKDGVPVARVSIGGKLWQVDASGRETDVEIKVGGGL